MDSRKTAPTAPLAPTGTEGLDAILGGGLPAHRVYLVEGIPGSGKTTLAIQFLMEGVRRGEKSLLARALRSDPSHHGLVIAAMPGWGEERDRQRARSRLRPPLQQARRHQGAVPHARDRPPPPHRQSSRHPMLVIRPRPIIQDRVRLRQVRRRP